MVRDFVWRSFTYYVVEIAQLFLKSMLTEYDQENPKSHNAAQPTVLRGRDTVKSYSGCIFSNKPYYDGTLKKSLGNTEFIS